MSPVRLRLASTAKWQSTMTVSRTRQPDLRKIDERGAGEPRLPDGGSLIGESPLLPYVVEHPFGPTRDTCALRRHLSRARFRSLPCLVGCCRRSHWLWQSARARKPAWLARSVRFRGDNLRWRLVGQPASRMTGRPTTGTCTPPRRGSFLRSGDLSLGQRVKADCRDT